MPGKLSDILRGSKEEEEGSFVGRMFGGDLIGKCRVSAAGGPVTGSTCPKKPHVQACPLPTRPLGVIRPNEEKLCPR